MCLLALLRRFSKPASSELNYAYFISTLGRRVTSGICKLLMCKAVPKRLKTLLVLHVMKTLSPAGRPSFVILEVVTIHAAHPPAHPAPHPRNPRRSRVHLLRPEGHASPQHPCQAAIAA